MRHSCQLSLEPHLRTASVRARLPDCREGDCLKVSQHSLSLYLSYLPDQQLQPHQCFVGTQIALANGIQNGPCSIEKVNLTPGEKAVVNVNADGWLIISRQRNEFERNIFDHCRYIWNGAVILYAGEQEVWMRFSCDRPMQLTVNCLLQIIQEGLGEKQRNEEETAGLQFTLGKESEVEMKFGYVHQVLLPNIRGALGFIGESQLYSVKNELPFPNCPSIEEFLSSPLWKQVSKEQQPQTVIATCANIPAGSYQCTAQNREMSGLTELITVRSKQAYETVTLHQFLQNKEDSLQIAPLSLYSTLQTLKDCFIRQFEAQITLQKYFYFLDGNSPFLLGGSVCRLRLLNKGLSKSRKIILGDFKGREIGLLLATKILLKPSPNLQETYKDMGRCLRSKSLSQTADPKYSVITALFSAVYGKEINEIMKHVEGGGEYCLISSYSSNGKTLAHGVLSSRGHRTWRVDLRSLNDPKYSVAEICDYLQWCIAFSPYQCLYLDDIDCLCRNLQEADHQFQERVAGKVILRRIMQYLSKQGRRCIITAKAEQSLDSELQMCVQSHICLKNPNAEQRTQALNQVNASWKGECLQQGSMDRGYPESCQSPEREDGQCSEREDGQCSVSILKGRKEMEFRGEPPFGCTQEIVRGTQSLSFGGFVKGALALGRERQPERQPERQSERQSERKLKKERRGFQRIAGLGAVKEAIRDIIAKPIKYAKLYEQIPIKLPRGVLLYGATGNGKSAIGTVTQEEFGMKYFSVKGSDILSKYIGGSEAAVRDIFEKAMTVSPSIVFFDEFQSIVPRRNSDNTGVNDRIVNQFLCYLDGVVSMTGVFIIAASSRPDLIDPAVLRPGRLDCHLFLDYPSAKEREQMIKMFAGSVQIEGVALQEIVRQTTQYSYSDLIGLLKELRIKKSAEVLKDSSVEHRAEEFIGISEELFRNTLSSFKLSVSPETQAKQRRIYQAFRDGKQPDVKSKQVQY